MDVLVTCKYEEYPIKNEGARVDTTLYSNFFRRARADHSGVGVGIWPKFKLIQTFMHALVTCKNEDDRIKNEVRSGRISNSSEMLWMFSLPASMKKIQSKMKALEWTQHFPHYNPMGAICRHGNQSSNPTWSKT